ncbi:hypothetical protein PBAL39_03739 [Pedobacter sp. BAL39]|uniref:DUF5686 and carboxypeptidase regulatory-like domain-containing protein n=1 Tax=Pedobacter sp. BAL39 TaxID=391596 RepID=UPI000155932E|nr:DUF5686 and carboxypeptidase regulatory-like domain-containing protein [Pedobacter sp. BAL39]EDM35623.1 hypothetical protein PBAL39_03739 [Pedobacter sp. BAL39]
MNKVFATLLLLFSSLSTLLAQDMQLRGSIKDAAGEAIPFASVFIKNTTQGSSANVDGIYSMAISKGTFSIIYKAIGYKPVEKTVTISGNTTENITLVPETVTLSTVTIDGNAEDPAYEIIRQAIKRRKEHLNEVGSYTAHAYVKGLQKLVGAPKKFFGRDIQKTLELDTNRKGILYLSESTSNISVERPDKIHEEMISSKIAGQNNAFSFNKASDLLANFYDNILLQNTVSNRGFVSPIADNAMFYYRYKLLGVSNENGIQLNKIAVIPRRENDPVFRGVIYIKEDSYHLVNADVYLIKNAGINFVDTLRISQQFLGVEKTYMPSALNFRFNGNVLGFKYEGYYVAVYSQYNLNPDFPKGHFNGEILKVTKAVNKKDSLFWLNNRPIPLTTEERLDYIRKDSLATLKQSKRYLDSLEKVNNKFGLGKLFLNGYTINNRYKRQSLTFDPIAQSVFYNTVEGFAVKYGVAYTKRLDYGRYFQIQPEARYGFSNKLFTAHVSGVYRYDPVKRASVSASFGSDIVDLNNYGTMTLPGIAVNALLFERNFAKFYKKEFVNAGANRELADGLQTSLFLEYARNTHLNNTADYKIFDYGDRNFSSNNPFAPSAETPLFPTYKALTVNAALTYTIGQTYITRPDSKIYEGSKYPSISLYYKKGISGVLGSDVDYDLLGLEIYKERINTGLWGYSSIILGAGKFLNNASVYFPEFKHFRGNKTLLSKPNQRKFLFLDFYLNSTDEEYFEAHFEHNFSGLITNKIPLLRKFRLEEIAGVNYLSQPIKRNYTEFYFGLQRLIFRATYGFAYDGNKRVQHGIRLTYGL